MRAMCGRVFYRRDTKSAETAELFRLSDHDFATDDSARLRHPDSANFSVNNFSVLLLYVSSPCHSRPAVHSLVSPSQVS